MMTNRDRVDRGMRHLALGPNSFVSEQMAAAFPDGKDWVAILVARNPSRYGDGRRYSQSDPRFLLRVITEEWRVFREPLARVEQGYAAELKDAGNRWAHGEEFCADDTYRTLDTMERLLMAVSATGQSGEVRALQVDFQQPVIPAAALSVQAHTAQKGPSAPPQSGPSTEAWSRVACTDVFRAIEEYERPGQERFLAEHGFDKATANLPIYRGRSYDAKTVLGAAYAYATGVRIGARDFSGVHGAAGVLPKLGSRSATRGPQPVSRQKKIARVPAPEPRPLWMRPR